MTELLVLSVLFNSDSGIGDVHITARYADLLETEKELSIARDMAAVRFSAIYGEGKGFQAVMSEIGTAIDDFMRNRVQNGLSLGMNRGRDENSPRVLVQAQHVKQ